MLRRTFVSGILGASLMASGAAFASGDTVLYMPGDIKAALEKGDTVFVDYFTSWCGTCKRQERVIDAFREANPAYNKAMTFIKVDWDVYASHEVSTSRNIPRRSTLLVLKGDK